MKAGHIHHVEIYVSNLERSSAFWGWFLGTLGYATHQRWKSGVSFKLGNTYLAFVRTEPRFLDIPYHRCRTGLNHLAFHAESRTQIDKMTEQLRGRGISILYGDKHPHAGGDNYYGVFFEDPDRIKVELVAPRED